MRKNSFFGFLILLFLACTPAKVPLNLSYQGYRVSAQQAPPDTGLQNLIAPYAVEVNKTMNRVIGFANNTLTKRMPNNTLGCFMTDCYKAMATEKFGKTVDVAFMNQGGIRSDINKGNITIGNVYELMPFDNLLIVQELSGEVLERFFQLIAADGGWPISSGSSYTIEDKKAVGIFVNGQPLDKTKKYIVANSDYVANGGSNATMLKSIPQLNKGYLMRDALIDYITVVTKSGKPIEATTEKRIIKKDE